MLFMKRNFSIVSAVLILCVGAGLFAHEVEAGTPESRTQDLSDPCNTPDSSPTLEFWEKATYEEATWLAGETGVVKVNIQVLPDGSVGSVSISKSSSYDMLDEAALTAAKKCIFLPRIKDCKPATADVSVMYLFPDRCSTDFPCPDGAEKPAIKYFKAPVYSEDARRAGQEGLVKVKVLIGKDGTVELTEVLESSGHQILDDAAIAAALGTLFHPGRQRCIPVRAWMALPYHFRLK